MSNKPPAWPSGVGRHVLGEIDSTNVEAQRRSADTEVPAWFLARRQTVGRGRRGRRWADPAGNFAASLLMRPGGSAGTAALRSFVAALALADALEASGVPASDIRLKWPNDVLVKDRKISGILLEASTRPGQTGLLVVGIGVNLLRAPPAVALEAGAVAPISLQEATGTQVDPEAFLDLLAPAFAHWEDRFRDDGFAAIRTAFLGRAGGLGRRVTARTGAGSLTGAFHDIDADGALVLATGAGMVSVPAAEIFF